MEHYRCYRVYIPKTRGERIADTVEFLPEHTKVPFASSADRAAQAATELTEALRNPAPAAPFSQVGDRQLAALDELAEIFQTQTHPARAPRVDKQPSAASPRVLPSPPPREEAPTARVAPPARVATPAQTAPPPRVTPVPEKPTVPTVTQDEDWEVEQPTKPAHRYPTRFTLSQQACNMHTGGGPKRVHANGQRRGV